MKEDDSFETMTSYTKKVYFVLLQLLVLESMKKIVAFILRSSYNLVLLVKIQYHVLYNIINTELKVQNLEVIR